MPLEATLYIKVNSHCRDKPETWGYSALILEGGSRYPILKFDRDGWWLVKVERPGESTIECWVGQKVGIPEGNFVDVPTQR